MDTQGTENGMTFTFEPWMKTALIVIGIVVLIAMAVFLYFLIVGADESRRKQNTESEEQKK